MAGDLDRAGRGSGGAAGRAGVIQAGRSSAGPVVSGREFLQDWRGFLSFFVILFMFFDMFVIDCLIVVSD